MTEIQRLQAIVPLEAPSNPRLGLEMEMFGYDAVSLAPLGMPGARLTPQALLERVHAVAPGSHLKVDAPTGVVVGLELGCGNFSLEPGGQLEYASCPQESLQGLLSDLGRGLELLEEGARGEALFLDHGTNPLAGPDLALLVPKQRYCILDRYFASQAGGRGVHMMRYSATAQPNIDVPGREAWLDAVNLGLTMTPLARALFANSRYFHGRLLPPGSERQRIWDGIDSSRTGVPPGLAFQRDIPQAYADWARHAYVFLAGDLPMEEQPRYGELTFADWEERGYKGTRPGLAEWETHLATLFPVLRLRRFLEVRMVDAQSFEHALAPVAFWAVALQNPEARARLWHLLKEVAAGIDITLQELPNLSPENPVVVRAVPRLLHCVTSCCQDELARRSLEAFASWVEERQSLAYPEAAVDFVRAQATAHPSRRLLSLVTS